MKTLKLIAIAVTAAAVAGPAFAGRDEAQTIAQQRAYNRLNTGSGLAGSVGLQGKVGPASSRAMLNLGHPTQRVRR